MTIIYRIQNNQGEGPYYRDSIQFVIGGHCDGSSCNTLGWRPFPYADGIEDAGVISTFLKEKNHYKCAFLTMEDLRKWFCGHDLAQLSNLGYHIVTLEVEEVYLGAHQVLYRPMT